MSGSKHLADLRSLQTALNSLSRNEQMYVEARLHGSLPVPAARIAGFSDPDEAAKRLENTIGIRNALEHSTRIEAHKLEFTRSDVLSGFMDAVRMAATATELVAAWREIGKIQGVYAPTEVNVNVSKAEQVKTLSDKELADMASEGGEIIDAEFVELED